MRQKVFLLVLIVAFLGLESCGSSQKTSGDGKSLQEEMDDRNAQVIPLLTRIKRLPGIGMQGGVPVFVKYQSGLGSGRNEPLYVVDGLIIGNSFRRIKDIVQPVDVESIKGLTGAEAGFYGARGAQGVIEIKTKSGS